MHSFGIAGIQRLCTTCMHHTVQRFTTFARACTRRASTPVSVGTRLAVQQRSLHVTKMSADSRLPTDESKGGCCHGDASNDDRPAHHHPSGRFCNPWPSFVCTATDLTVRIISMLCTIPSTNFKPAHFAVGNQSVCVDASNPMLSPHHSFLDLDMLAFCLQGLASPALSGCNVDCKCRL